MPAVLVCVLIQALNNAGGVGLMPAAGPAILPAMISAGAIKRPALVDNKTGLPVYQPLTAGSLPYQQLPAAQLPLQPARYISLPSRN